MVKQFKKVLELLDPEVAGTTIGTNVSNHVNTYFHCLTT
jgi:hypothetical protein